MPSAAPARAHKPEDEDDTLRNIVLQQAIRDWEGERMGDVFAHLHALKHGLSEDEILHAWANFVKSQQREAPGEDQCVRIGYGLESSGAVQMIGVMKPFGTLIVHAMTPPQKSVLEELGIPGRR